MFRITFINLPVIPINYLELRIFDPIAIGSGFIKTLYSVPTYSILFYLTLFLIPSILPLIPNVIKLRTPDRETIPVRNDQNNFSENVQGPSLVKCPESI